MKRVIFIGVLGLLLAGCAGGPTADEIRSADYGWYPSNYQEIVQHYFVKKIAGSNSLEYTDWRGPGKGFVPKYFGLGSLYGYELCVNVSADIQKGSRSGGRQYYLLLHDNDVVYVDGDYGGNDQTAHKIAIQCNRIHKTGN